MRTPGSALLIGSALLVLRMAVCVDLESAGTGASADDVAVHPNLIVHNARIYTLDKALSTHQAMALRGNRVWKLGTDKEILPLAGKETEVIDAKNRVVLPGLVDAHTHPHVWGVLHWGYKYDPQLQWLYIEAKDVTELKSRLEERITERIRQAGPGKWIIAAVPERADRARVLRNDDRRGSQSAGARQPGDRRAGTHRRDRCQHQSAGGNAAGARERCRGGR